MFSKLVKGEESQKNFLMLIKADMSQFTQKVESYSIIIKKLKHQFGQMSTTLNQRKMGTPLTKIVQNSKNDFYCLAITTQRGKTTVDLLRTTLDERTNNSVEVDETHKVESKKVKGVDGNLRIKR